MATKKIIEVDVVNSLSDSDTIFVNSDNSLKQIPKSNLVTKGEAGGFYTPAVTQPDENTMRFSFTPSKEGMPAVADADITLPAGGGGGGSGEDGGYYTPAVTQTAENTMQVAFTPSKTTMPAVPGTEITLPEGPAGKPGAGGKSAYAYAVEGGYTGTEEKFAAKLAQEQLTGTTNDFTPAQVYEAVSAGIPVKVQYLDATFGLLSYTNFSVAESMNIIAANTIVYFNGSYILGELFGDKSKNVWGFMITTLAQKADIPSALPNPNAITFTGAVTGTYDGSAPFSVKIPSAVTDDHINSLIEAKLGVIENGYY